MASQPIAKLTEQDYLALERAAEYKSEFVDGEMYAMSGGTSRHSRLARLKHHETGSYSFHAIYEFRKSVVTRPLPLQS